ncbi:GH1 family beta-glucosidase [Rufibacter roseus]|uniref:Beta-glucosidase n=1 Tax=Rufibacter roseus TaxID=1567108 RepID=A0ABW2DIS5_9BACT|nr:GH1 family beta-glucosidase [Rufibacter roseus]
MNSDSAEMPELTRAAFGPDFIWGTSTAAYQIEGAFACDDKGPSIWDEFTQNSRKIKQGHHAQDACEFYHRYQDDLALMRELRIPNFRMSLSWPRLIPQGIGAPNPKGIDFYNRLIDHCLELGITPWVTLYHWDLPAALEKRGGWTNRDVVGWFREYAHLCASKFGDRVKNWMVLNEPMVFVGAGYSLGVHAPGRWGLRNFLSATHHATLCQAEGGRVLRSEIPDAQIGTTFSCSHLTPYRQLTRDKKAVKRVDALLNRLFLEPALGLGYPTRDLPYLKKLEKYYQPGDEDLLPFDFDFIGVQNYTREVVKYSLLTPILQAMLVSAPKRKVPHTLMKWEVYPESIYHMLRQYSQYPQIKKLIVTENGAAFPDQVVDGKVHDPDRVAYLQSYLQQVLRAKHEGAKVEGYFVWSFLDNFEWAEGYDPRFGLVYVDYETQKRIVKSSGRWYRDMLAEQ